MAMVKCKECGKEISSKAKSCPSCGAPPAKKTSRATWLIAIFILVWIFSVLISDQTPETAKAAPSAPNPARTVTPVKVVIDIPSIAGKTADEVSTYLGSPIECHQIKSGETRGEKCTYKKAETEVVFIDGKADWITVSDMNGAPFSPPAITALGLPETRPGHRNKYSMRWNDISEIKQVSIFPAPLSTVDYAYIIVATSH